MELLKQCKRLALPMLLCVMTFGFTPGDVRPVYAQATTQNDSEIEKEPLMDATKESGKTVSNAIKQKLSNLKIFLGITVLFGVIIFFIARRKGK